MHYTQNTKSWHIIQSSYKPTHDIGHKWRQEYSGEFTEVKQHNLINPKSEINRVTKFILFSISVIVL